ncbi:MAG: Mn-dependent DtxR family transcriptional regulator [Pseudoalteromonas tetraodonis]|jgi:Mn-dependent DtxR family transcriptional regulator
MPALRQSAPQGSRAQEDYLEQIHNLIEEKGYARVVDVAKNLGLAQASVTNMIQRLDADGLVHYEKYRGVVLTADGERIALAIIRRHEKLTNFLELFGLDDATIYEDVEGMEHHTSPETLAAIISLTAELERQPALLKRVRRAMKDIKA